MSDTPTCNQCGEPISWNKTVRANFGIKGPLEPDETKKHTCDEQKKKEYQATKSAEAVAREKAAAMGGGGGGNSNNAQQLSGIEVYLKGQLEELRRAVDHLSRIAMFVESLDFRVKKIEESRTYSKPSLRPVLSDSESSSTVDSDEIIGGVQDV